MGVLKIERRGMSLTELMLVIILTSIIMLAVTGHFVAETRFRLIAQDRIEVTREARIAMNHMSRILRFALPGTISIPAAERITAVIDGDPVHLSSIPSDTNIEYERNAADNTLEYTYGVPPAVSIAGGGERNTRISSFTPSWDGNVITLKVTAESSDGNNSITLQTSIKPLGGD